jgi:hypothetical protein
MLSHRAMFSKTTLALGTALTTMALWSFIDCSLAQDAVAVPFTAIESDDIDEDCDKDNKSRRRSHKNAGRLDTGNSALANANENLSHGITNIADTAEAEAVVVRGSFDIYPVEYPALPPVEGTRINAGKKTSFVKPEEFPTFAGNDYREVMATTPGIIVSEEPQSPIINFGYRGLNSQRSEFMQVLEDGISLKTSSLVFLKRITPQSWMRWSGLNSFVRAQLCSTGANPVEPSILS